VCTTSQIQAVPAEIIAAYNTCKKRCTDDGKTVEPSCFVCGQSNCSDDCCKHAYFFPIVGVLPTTYLFQEIKRDVAFNLLLISLLFLLQLRKCKVQCFKGFCVKPVNATGDIPQTQCFPLNVEGYVANDDAYEFYKTIRNVYTKVKTCCVPKSCKDGSWCSFCNDSPNSPCPNPTPCFDFKLNGSQIRICTSYLGENPGVLTTDQTVCLYKIINGPLCPEYLFYFLLCQSREYRKCIREIMCQDQRGGKCDRSKCQPDNGTNFEYLNNNQGDLSACAPLTPFGYTNNNGGLPI
jgi:hypothetical protein